MKIYLLEIIWLKVYIFWESHKIFAKSPPIIGLAVHGTNNWWRFCKILWPSQNIWTLQKVDFRCHTLNLFNFNRNYISSNLNVNSSHMSSVCQRQKNIMSQLLADSGALFIPLHYWIQSHLCCHTFYHVEKYCRGTWTL